MAILELDQTYETPLTEYQRGPFRLRYAYARSKDCRLSSERGQDYLVWRIETARAAFALCDGVGQSFFGGLASQVVGEALIEWLWKLPLEDEARGPDTHTLAQGLQSFLDSKKEDATKIIDDKDIQSVGAELIRDALEERRKKRGTQSNFVCGIVDIPSQNYPEGRVLLFWLGDAKLQIWQGDTDRTSELNATWDKQEGWSSRFGTFGKVHTFKGTLKNFDCIIAHSDGVDPIEHKLSPALTSTELNAQFATLGEDDASFLQLCYLKLPVDIEDDIVSIVRESPLVPVKVLLVPTETIKEPPPPPPPPPPIPRWVYAALLIILLGFSATSGVVGYSLGRRTPRPLPIPPPPPTTMSPPMVLTETPTIQATDTPLTSPTVSSTASPTISLTPATSTSPPAISSTPAGVGNNLGVLYMNPSNSGIVVLQPGICQPIAQNGTILVKGPYLVRAYPNLGCDGESIKTYSNGDNVSLENNIRGLFIVELTPEAP